MKYKGVPQGGWKERTWYLVEVAFSADNVIHRSLFYTGFLNGNGKTPGGYNCFVGINGTYEEPLEYKDAYHLVPLQKLFSTEDLDGKCQGMTPEMLEQDRKESRNTEVEG